VVERSLLARLADGTYASRGVQQLSGGQWRRLSLSLTLAFAQVPPAFTRSKFTVYSDCIPFKICFLYVDPKRVHASCRPLYCLYPRIFFCCLHDRVNLTPVCVFQCSLERTATTCNLLVLDEVLQHLDSEVSSIISMVEGDACSQLEALNDREAYQLLLKRGSSCF
jgi:hypothetical protein